MLSHEDLIAVITAEHPGLRHGVDFWVGQPMNGDQQTGTAFVAAWTLDDPAEPDDNALALLIVKHQTAIDANRLEARHQAINAHRDQRMEAGSSFTVTGLAEPIPLTGRPIDRSVYLGLLAQAQAAQAQDITDAVHLLRDASNTNHTLTPVQMIELVNKAMQWFEATMAVSWAMKDRTAPFAAGIPDDFTNNQHWP